MGWLDRGVWRTDWYRPDEAGRFRRPPTRFHGRIEDRPDAPHPAESGRYHLYVSLACPWAHRTLVTRAYLGLEEAISVTVVDPLMGEDGWAFTDADPDPVRGARHLRELYLKADPHYTGRVTVPVLWDLCAGTIVNNESREIMRMLGTAMGRFGRSGRTLLPPGRRAEVDAELDALYGPVNDGVYRAGFAATQEAYEEAARALFAALDRYEARLSERRYLLGDVLTEADVAFYATLVRFDTVYYGHFKCNLRRIQDYPALWGYLRDLYQTPGFGETTDLDHVRRHYYWSQPSVNPTRIWPIGPEIDFEGPHGREALSR